GAARDHLEHVGAERVRLLLEREPGGRPPALEPEARAADRRVREAPDAPVQRLRRPGRCALRRHGPAPELLNRRRALHAAVVAACLAPMAWLAVAAWRDELGADPIKEATHATGLWTLRFLLATLAVTPLRRAFGWSRLAP